MTVNFDYQTCTIEELADYIEISTTSRITQTLIYYKKKDVPAMVEKITSARKLVKKRKLTRMLEEL